MHTKQVIVGRHAGLGAGLVQAGPLLFTSGRDGDRQLDTGNVDAALADAVEAQCENAYGGIAALLRQAGIGMDCVVRLDHFTRSQDWLPRRQSVRGRIFGKPAPLSSTGVAARMAGSNLLTAAAVAVPAAQDKQVLVSGPEFGMENISASVAAGPFIFVSGLRAAAAGPALFDQARAAYEKLRQILARSGCGMERIVRLEVFLRAGQDRQQERLACRAVAGDVEWAASTVSLSLGARGDLEITAMALAPGHGDKEIIRMPDGKALAAVRAGGFVLIGACHGADLRQALALLDNKLQLAGADLSTVARLDICQRDDDPDRQLDATLQAYFPAGLPAIVFGGADPGGDAAASVCAIAVQR